MGGVFAGTVITQQSGNLTPALCLFLFQPKILSNTGEFVWVGWVVDLALSCVYLNLIILPCTAKTGINDCTLLPMLPFANPILFPINTCLFLFHICLASNQRLAFPSEPAGPLPRLAAEQSNPSLGIRKEAPRHQKGDPGCLAGGFLDTTNTNTCINTNTSSNTNTSTDSNTNSFESSKCLTFCWQGFQKDLHCLRRLAELLPWLHNRFVSPHLDHFFYIIFFGALQQVRLPQAIAFGAFFFGSTTGSSPPSNSIWSNPENF